MRNIPPSIFLLKPKMVKCFFLLLTITLFWGCNSNKIDKNVSSPFLSGEEVVWLSTYNFKEADSIQLEKVEEICAKLLDTAQLDLCFDAYIQHVQPYISSEKYIKELGKVYLQLNSYNQIRFADVSSLNPAHLIKDCNYNFAQEIIRNGYKNLGDIHTDSLSAYKNKVQLAQLRLFRTMNRCESNVKAQDFITLSDSCLQYLNQTKRDTQNLLYIYNNLGGVYYHLNLFEQTIQAVENVEQYLGNDTFKRIRAIHNKGLAFLAMNDSSHAYFWANKCLTMVQHFGNASNDAYRIAYNGMHEYYRFLGSKDSQNRYAKLMGTLSRDLDNVSRLKTTLFSINEMEPAKAFAVLDSIKDKVNKELDTDMRIYMYQIYSNNYAKVKNYAQAYRNLLISDSLKTESFSTNKSLSVLELERKYNDANKDKEIAEKEILIQNERTKQEQLKFLYLVIILSILLLASLLFYWQVAQNNKRKNINQQKYNQMLLDKIDEKEKSIANELHDSLGQDIVSVKYSLENNDKLQTRELVNGALENLRSIVRNMHPVEVENSSLKLILEKQLKTFETISNIHLSHYIQDVVLGASDKLQYYRIFQEALNNILKHSKATAVNIVFRDNGEEQILEIEDDGVGFSESEIMNPFGIHLMRQRAKGLKATITIESAIGKGTHIKLSRRE